MSIVDFFFKDIPQPLYEDKPTKAKKKTAIFQTPSIVSSTLPPAWDKSKYLEASTSWVNACVNIIADVCAGLDIHLYSVDTKGDLEEIFDHELLDLIYNPNPLQTKFDFIWLIFNYLELTGEAPVLLDLQGGMPQGMYLLRPDRLGTKFISGNEDSQQLVDYYTYQKNSFDTIRLEAKEVIKLMYPNPNKYYEGIGTLSAVKATVDTDNFAEDWNKNFYYNSARPDFVLETEKNLKDDHLKRLRVAWNNFFGRGSHNAHKMAILDGGLKMNKMGMSQKDMDFIMQNKFTRDKILSIFRVPKSVLGITEDVNRANAEASYYVFAKYCIKPKMKRIIEQLNEFLVPLYGDNLILDFDDPVPDDNEQKLATYQNALQNGWMTINEVRDKEGLETVDGGDEAYRPFNLQPVGEMPEDAEQEMVLEHFNMKAKRLSVPKKEVYNDIKSSVKKELVKKKKKEYEAKRRAIWEQWLNEVKKYEKQIKDLFIGIFKEQEKQVIESLGESKKQLEFNEEYENEKTANRMEKLLLAIVLIEGGRRLREIVPTANFTIDNVTREYIKKHSFELVKGINATTKKKLKNEYIKAVANNEDIPDIKKRIEKVFKEATKSRAEMIARTESSAVANDAAIKAYEESGVVFSKEWLVDGKPCPICTPMDGQVVPNKATFTGGDGNRYNAPPVHPNCMCTLLPVVSKSSPSKIKQILKEKPDINLKTTEEWVDNEMKEFTNLIKELKEIENGKEQNKKTKK